MTPFLHVSWRTTAITAALGVLLSAAHLNAQALALGPLTSLSSLGEPLAAGIAIPEITPEEFASLKVTLASPEAFKNAGMEYNPALTSVQFTVNRRPDGTTYVLLRSDKAVTDPFVNLVITAKWSSGQIVRNYTLLLDPPAARPSVAPATAITAPIATLPAPRSTPTPAPSVASTPPAEPVSRPGAETKTAVAPIPKSPSMSAPKPAPIPAPAPKSSGEQHKVTSGDTAGKIAAANKPVNVSLDQMLVAMLRGNPEAFIGKNVNRLKAGSVLSMPTSEEAQAISDNVARQDVIAQSKDFNNFRRKLAENAPSIASKAPDRQASGKVEAKVEERKSAAVTPDKLTLSKGSLNGDAKAAAGAKDNSEKIAKERQAKDDAARVAELSKNISDLNKIASGAAISPASPAKAVSATTPGATATAPSAATVATGAAVAVTTPAVVSAAASAAVKPIATPAVTPVTPVPTVSPAPNSTAVVAANAGATPPAPATATAAVTPVVPAELKTATAIPAPEPSFMDGLMDSPAVLPAAGGLLALLAGGGMYLANQRKKRAVEEDEELDNEFEDQSFFDTTNHEPVSQPAPAAAPVAATPAPEPSFTLPPLPVPIAPVVTQTALEVAPVAVTAVAAAKLTQEPEPVDAFSEMAVSEFSARTVAQLDPESAKSPASVDLDLDFDFDVSGFQNKAPTAAAMAATAPAADLDFEIASTNPTTTHLPAHSKAAAVAVAASALASAPAASIEPDRSGMIEFDLDNLSLDLNASNQSAGSALAVDSNGPLETKLALAQEFRAIGDASGAKMLAQEVIALASGSLKIKAENLLTEIG